MNGIFSSSRYSKVYWDEWYGALSITTTWLFLHLGLILSSAVANSLKKRPIVIELVFDYVKERNTSPWESNATIIEILGFSFFPARLLLWDLYAQFIFRKSVTPIHDSSMFITVLPYMSVSRNLRAHFYLR